jgi:hypothetical protein
MSIDEVTRATSYCGMLHSAIAETSLGPRSDHGLLWYAYNIQWQGCKELSEKGKSAVCVLEARRKALQCLISCQKYTNTVMLQHLMRTELMFRESTTTPISPHHISLLNSFHATLIPSPGDMLNSPVSCDQFVPVVEYLLHRVVLASKAGQESELLRLCEAAVEEHERVCQSAHHRIVGLQTWIVGLWKSISGQT